jgi:uncharacterized membrane protein YfcA
VAVDDPLALALLAAVGLAAGTINTMAGGGSLVTLPALIFLGLPPQAANATNRVGILLQSLAATESFRRSKTLPALRAVAPRALAAGLGAGLGAWLSVQVEPDHFRVVIAVAMLVMLLVLLLKPRRWIRPRPAAPAWVQILGFFGIGVYGGFLQAGVGIFLLAGSALLSGEDLVRGNAVKNLLVLGFTLPALAYFAAQGLVAVVPGLALAAGSMAGGWLGARLAVKLGAGFVRLLLVAVVVVASTRLLGLW